MQALASIALLTLSGCAGGVPIVYPNVTEPVLLKCAEPVFILSHPWLSYSEPGWGYWETLEFKADGEVHYSRHATSGPRTGRIVETIPGGAALWARLVGERRYEAYPGRGDYYPGESIEFVRWALKQ